MKKSTTQTIFIIVGAVIFLAVLGVGLSALLFMRATEFTKSDEHSADATWDEIRVRFNRASPVIQVQDDETVTVTRRPPTTAPASVQQLQIVAWDPDDNNLVKITLPFWLLRLKSGPIELGSRGVPGSARRLNLTVEELERYGPALVIDHVSRHGERVLVWTE